MRNGGGVAPLCTPTGLSDGDGAGEGEWDGAGEASREWFGEGVEPDEGFWLRLGLLWARSCSRVLARLPERESSGELAGKARPWLIASGGGEEGEAAEAAGGEAIALLMRGGTIGGRGGVGGMGGDAAEADTALAANGLSFACSNGVVFFSNTSGTMKRASNMRQCIFCTGRPLTT
jgi:hypothetical protein